MWFDASNVRRKSIYQIQYVVISKQYDSINILPPKEFENIFLSLIQQLPKSLVQLDGRTTEYIYREWFEGMESGYDISIVYDFNLTAFLPKISNKPLTVVFVDPNVEKEKVIKQLNDLSFNFYVYNANTEAASEKEFSTSFQLISRLKRDKEKLSRYFQGFKLPVDFRFSYNIPEEFKKENRFTNFTPSLGNFLMLNQYIGNLWHDDDYINELTRITEEDELGKIIESSKRPDRMQILADQIDRIDSFRKILSEERNQRNELGDAVPYYTPLLIVAPFQYPKLEDILPNIAAYSDYYLIKEAFRSEQDLDYRNSLDIRGMDTDKIRKVLLNNGEVVQRKVKFLDRMAYLHASFTFSPILRLPLKGKSLHRFLSIFDPLRPLPRKSKFLQSINKFGEYYVSNSINENIQNKISERNRQLIFISDLPVEWFNIKGVPLSITHDTTRLPEIPTGGLMALYVKNAMMQYSIPADILKKTLVIFGIPTDNEQNRAFAVAYSGVEEMSKELGFKVARCNSIADLRKAIENNTPDLLIFDTHGKSDTKKKTSMLQIGSEWLTGDDIIKFKICAPLVILSACNTIPNWGYLNPISNALFETGSISITGTFLPIGILSGTVFYQRIINNLKFAVENVTHSNWLNFMSHNIRSHYLSEILVEVQKKITLLPINLTQKQILGRQAMKIAARLLNESMSFSRRRSLFIDVKNRYKSIHPKINIDFSQLPLEQLLYTNLGRGDLVYFKNWLDQQSR